MSEGHENWNEGRDGCYQRNDIFGFGIARGQHAHLYAKHANPLIFLVLGKKLQQELSEGHENWYEGGDGRCRQNDIFGFGIARAQRALLCAKRANPLIFMVLGEKLRLELSEGHENWHEGGDEHCRQNDIFCFWIARAAHAFVRKACKSTHFHGFLGKSCS